MTSKFTADQLAKTYIITQRLGGRNMRRGIQPGKVLFAEHPAVLVQAAFLETFRPTSPTEVYSDKMPNFIPSSREEEGWIPIDVLLGSYKPKTRTIVIYRKPIARFASHPLKCGVSDLEFIVRLHEYAHALVHVGVLWPEEPDVLRKYLQGQETDWRAFVRDRSKAFRVLDTQTGEFLAQTLCWMAMGVVEPFVQAKHTSRFICYSHGPTAVGISSDF